MLRPLDSVLEHLDFDYSLPNLYYSLSILYYSLFILYYNSPKIPYRLSSLYYSLSILHYSHLIMFHSRFYYLLQPLGPLRATDCRARARTLVRLMRERHNGPPTHPPRE